MKTFPIFILIIFLISCRKPDPHPELRDPILREIADSIKLEEANVESLDAELLATKEDLKNSADQSMDIKLNRQKLFETENRLAKAKQMLSYYKVQQKLRTQEARRSYIEAFKAEKEKEWPDPKEYEAYLRSKGVKLEKAEKKKASGH